MKKFRTALFNGYRRDAVDEYLEDLTQKLEDLQEDAKRGRSAEQLLSQMEKENEELRNQLQAQTEKLEKETEQRQRLQKKQQDMQKEHDRLKELNEKNTENEEKLRKYESDYSGFMALMVSMKEQARQIVTDAQADAEQVLVMAKKEADGITTTARQNAEEIEKQAQNEAESYRKSVETELEKKRQEEARKFELARFKVAGYLEALNRSQNKLLEVYEEFGRVVEKLPLRIGDVFSEEPFELLDGQKKENRSDENVEEWTECSDGDSVHG